jgi:hypothetical protein
VKLLNESDPVGKLLTISQAAKVQEFAKRLAIWNIAALFEKQNTTPLPDAGSRILDMLLQRLVRVRAKDSADKLDAYCKALRIKTIYA